MSDFSTITDLQGATHNVKDATARQALEYLSRQAVKSVNEETPDANGNVAVKAENIPANGMGTKETSENPIVIEDGVAGNALDLSVDLEPIQSGSGTPSPDNIRPISGYDSVSVQRTGHNIWDEQWEVGAYDGQGNKVSASRLRCKNKIPVTPSTSYYAVCAGSYNSWLNIVYFDANEAWVSTASTVVGQVFTTPSDAYYMAFNTSDAYGTTYFNDIAINYPSTFTEYEPYSGSTATISLTSAGTVYGGTLDFDTGVLTVTHGTTTFTGTDAKGIEATGTHYTMYRVAKSITGGFSVSDRNTVICDSLRFIWGRSENTNYTEDMWFRCENNGSVYNWYVYARNGMFADLAEFKTWLTANPMNICLKLKTSTTHQLTPAQLALLEGYNILTSNADTIHLKYIGSEESDVQAEIDEFEVAIHALSESVAPIETGTATQPYAVGDYLLLNGQFCKVTAAIATGETITVGTNVAETSVGDEVEAINSSLSYREAVIEPLNNKFTRRDGFKAVRYCGWISVISYVGITEEVSAGQAFASITIPCRASNILALNSNTKAVYPCGVQSDGRILSDGVMPTGYYYFYGNVMAN